MHATIKNWNPVTEPRTIRVEASTDAIIEGNLDTLEGEQFDFIHDVIHVDESERDVVIFTTCRTIERPTRPVFRIPRRMLAGWEAV